MKDKTTEQSGIYRNLEKKSVREILSDINQEDQSVANAVRNSIEDIEKLVKVVLPKMIDGGRLFYIGAGTSGRLGILDASECPPTFGVSHNTVIGLIAGGDSAIRKAVEFAEDDTLQAVKDLDYYNINVNDFVIGIAASGTTPYVIGGIEDCKKRGIKTGCITCNLGSPLAAAVDFAIEVVVGPEYVTGSTRMKSGTAQKMVLNMISTSLMIKLGKVRDNKMVDMQLSNDKLVDRGVKMIMSESDLTYEEAKALLLRSGSVRKSMEVLKSK